jgi:hypothetical protein
MKCIEQFLRAISRSKPLKSAAIERSLSEFSTINQMDWALSFDSDEVYDYRKNWCELQNAFEELALITYKTMI